MSRKHNQRTRAEILAKRNVPITTWAGWTRRVPAVITTSYTADARRAARSKYMPHIGAKEQERAKRCYMSAYLNGRSLSSILVTAICGHLRHSARSASQRMQHISKPASRNTRARFNSKSLGSQS
ncbi:MAG: hypothetical protein CPSOU_1836 [uncultured Paraburkholderia sp.]|nr:MAG: hypothetical protein CPSOU_1836 [uncultured Paraburkholderia sp.]